MIVFLNGKWRKRIAIHMIRSFNVLCFVSLLTSALKIVSGAFGDIDLLFAGIADCNKHTIDIHWPLFSESPTNISLFPLNFSHISVIFHLLHQIGKQITKKKKKKERNTTVKSNLIEKSLNLQKLHTILE